MTDTNDCANTMGDRVSTGRGGPKARGMTLHPIPAVLAAALFVAGAGAADAAQPAAAKPAANVGPRIAALVVPTNSNFILKPTLERATGLTGVYQTSHGVYCLMPKKGIKIREVVPSMTVEYGNSFEHLGVVQWMSDPTRFGCKASELGAITLIPDGDAELRSNHVAFTVVVD